MEDDDVAFRIGQRTGCALDVVAERRQRPVPFAGHLQAGHVNAELGRRKVPQLRLGQPIARRDDEPDARERRRQKAARVCHDPLSQSIPGSETRAACSRRRPPRPAAGLSFQSRPI